MTTVNQMLEKFGQDSVNLLRSNMAKAGQNATGETSNNITSEMLSNTRVQVTAPSYVYVLETGRKPRESSQESDFRSKLEKWVRARGINFGGTIDQTVRSLQYLINKRGTKLWREGGRKDIITPVLDNRRFIKLTQDILDAQFNEVSNSIETTIKNG